MSRETLFLLLIQPVVLAVLWVRLPDIQQLCLKYVTSFGLAVTLVGAYCASRWGTVEWTSVQRVFNLDPSYEKDRANSLQSKLIIERCRYTDIKVKFDDLYSAHSLLRTDNERLHQEHIGLLKKNFLSRSFQTNLTSQVQSLSKTLVSERSTFLKEKINRRAMLGLILGFFQYALLAGKRIRFLSTGTLVQQQRFSTLLSGHLALRERYSQLMQSHSETLQSNSALADEIVKNDVAYKKLEQGREELATDLQAAQRDCRFYQALAWTVVARFDGLQADYGQLLTVVDRLKSEYGAFQNDLREASSLVQATQDVAQIGLTDLRQSTMLRPLKVKQNLMKIGQGLDLVHLSMTELLVDVGLIINREVGRALVVSEPSTESASASVESAIRKLKAMYETNEEGKDDNSDTAVGLSDDEELQDATLASISNIEQYDKPAIRTMASLRSIISKIESGDVRETLLNDLMSASDIVDKIQQLVDESKGCL